MATLEHRLAAARDRRRPRARHLAAVAQAEAYVRTRFYPPLPYQYGELAVVALDEYREHGPDSHVNLPADLPLVPRAVATDDDGDLYVTAGELIRVLRIEHMVDDAYDDDPDSDEVADPDAS